MDDKGGGDGTCGHAEALGQALGKQVKLILQRLDVILLSQAGNMHHQGWPCYATMQHDWYHSSKTLYYRDWLCTYILASKFLGVPVHAHYGAKTRDAGCYVVCGQVRRSIVLDSLNISQWSAIS